MIYFLGYVDGNEAIEIHPSSSNQNVTIVYPTCRLERPIDVQFTVVKVENVLFNFKVKKFSEWGFIFEVVYKFEDISNVTNTSVYWRAIFGRY